MTALDPQAKRRSLLLKLKRLTHSANPHEAALAQHRYDKLSEKWGITIDDEEVTPEGLKEIVVNVPVFGMPQRLAALTAMAEAEVQVLILEPMVKTAKCRAISFIGLPEDARKAQSIFEEVTREMETGYEWFRMLRGIMIKDRRSFLTGMFEAIGARFMKAAEDRLREERRRKDRDELRYLWLGLNSHFAQLDYDRAPAQPQGNELAVLDTAAAPDVKARALDLARDKYEHVDTERPMSSIVQLSHDAPESVKEGQRRGLTCALSMVPPIDLDHPL